MRPLDKYEKIQSIWSMDDEEDEIRPTRSHDDILSTGLGPDDEDWTGEDNITLENDADAKVDPGKCNVESDNLIAQYFGDVRRYPLLSFPEEKALWRRITRGQNRIRYALYTAPTSLPTLMGLWHQVEGGTLPFAQVVCEAGRTAHEQAKQRSQVEATLQCLQKLAARLRRHTRQRRASDLSVQKRQSLHHRGVRLWRQWFTRWEALGLHTRVFEALRTALDMAYQCQPDDQTLRRAATALAGAEQQLERGKEEMMQANLRLVIHLANRYRDHGVPFLDLIQEGNIGLMRALDKFEPQRGLKFVTYAHWWVRQAIGRALIEQHRTIRLPSHVIEFKNKLRTVGNRLWYTYGRAPSKHELSDALECTPQEVENLLTAVQPIVRLHRPITENGSLLADVVKDKQAVKPEELVAADQLHQCLEAYLARLPAREALIIRLRYGLDTDHAHTLQEIADTLGLSRERVRQIEKKAFEKLRQSRQSDVLADFADVA